MAIPPNKLPQGVQGVKDVFKAPGQEMQNEIQRLHNVLRSTTAQLMAHSQTVQELMKANLELRATLNLFQTDKNGLDNYLKGQNQAKPAPVVEPHVKPADDQVTTLPVSEPVPPVAKTDADPVSA